MVSLLKSSKLQLASQKLAALTCYPATAPEDVRLQPDTPGAHECWARVLNKQKESLLKKAMTTKFPSTLVLMELAEELSAKNCELQLQWIRRDLNQLADDLTNENFASFDPNFRIDLKGEALEWRVLGRLLRYATSYFEELGEAKRTKKVHATRWKLGPW